MSLHSNTNGLANADPSTDRFLREPAVLGRVGVSKMTLRRWEKAGRFPQRYKIGPNIVAWKESEIVRWLAARERASFGASKREAA